jgi:DNA-binding LacI/PurR family transcriptional regulator
VLLVFSRLMGQCLLGMLDAAKSADYSILLSYADRSVQDLRFLKAFSRGQVDGVIFQDVLITESIFKTVSTKLPVVQCGDYSNFPGADIVSIDNEEMAYRMTRHLIEKGYEQIAYVYMINRQGGDGSLSNARERGIRRALAESGLTLAQSHLIGLPMDLSISDKDKYLSGFDTEPSYLTFGREAVKKLQALPSLPRALFCYNDMLAYGCMRELCINGIDIPGDIAVSGFDGTYPASEHEPVLTSVVQPFYKMGFEAFNLLLAALKNKNSTEGRKILLDAALSLKSSTGD